MAEWLWTGMKWLLIALAVSPIVIGVGWAVVEGSILPLFVARREIEAMADDLMRRYPNDPEQRAFIEEHAAWYRSLSFEQGKWHRVRKLIRKRLQSGGQSIVL